MIFRKWGGGGSKAVWNFSKKSSLLEMPSFPNLECYQIDHPNTKKCLIQKEKRKVSHPKKSKKSVWSKKRPGGSLSIHRINPLWRGIFYQRNTLYDLCGEIWEMMRHRPPTRTIPKRPAHLQKTNIFKYYEAYHIQQKMWVNMGDGAAPSSLTHTYNTHQCPTKRPAHLQKPFTHLPLATNKYLQTGGLQYY